MLRSLDLEDFMLPKPIKVKANANVMEAVDLILQHRISGVCVVDDAGKLVGMLSETDCLRAILGATYNESGLGPVSEYMTKEGLVVTTTSCDVVDVAQRMLKLKLRRMPVVDNGQLVGQITCRQILLAVKNYSR
jgi:CBS domain-containing protein